VFRIRSYFGYSSVICLIAVGLYDNFRDFGGYQRLPFGISVFVKSDLLCVAFLQMNVTESMSFNELITSLKMLSMAPLQAQVNGIVAQLA